MPATAPPDNRGPADYAKLFANDPELKALALAADSNGDGVVTGDEIATSRDEMRRIFLERRRAESEKMVAQAQAAQVEARARIKNIQSRAATTNISQQMSEEIRLRYDLNNDGSLDGREWRGFVQAQREARRARTLGDTPTEAQKKEWALEDQFLVWSYSFDTNRDGVVDGAERESMVRAYYDAVVQGKDRSSLKSPLQLELGNIE